jgi:hypothetical protein
MENNRHRVYGLLSKDRDTGEILGWAWVVSPIVEAYMLGIWNEENRQAGLGFSLWPLVTVN